MPYTERKVICGLRSTELMFLITLILTSTVLAGMLKGHQVTDDVRLDTLEVIKAGGAGMLEEIERESETGRVLARLAHPHAPNRPLRLAAQNVLESMGQTPEDISDDIADWPTWRYEKGRGAATPHQLSSRLHLNWKRDLGSPRRAWPEQRDDYGKLAFDVSFEPVAAGGIIYVPSMVSDRLSAFDTNCAARRHQFGAIVPKLA